LESETANSYIPEINQVALQNNTINGVSAAENPFIITTTTMMKLLIQSNVIGFLGQMGA
jgi:hypothetical protein